MEDKNKKLFSTILLVVGVLFIVVSGGIFVSKTWKYLPDLVKKLCLLGVTAGFFAGSHYGEKSSLHKTGTALYYLGVCFTGFSTVALLSGTVVSAGWIRMLTLVAMLIPVAIRFFRDRKVIDLILQIFLCDGMLLSMSGLDEAGMGSKVSLMCFATFVMALAALIYYCRKGDLTEENGRSIFGCDALLGVSLVAYGWHAVICLPLTMARMISDPSFFFSLLPILMLVASVSVIWIAFDKNVLLRIAQSISFVYAAYAISAFFLHGDAALVWFGGFVLVLVLMMVLDRLELLAGASMIGIVATFFQLVQVVVMRGDERSSILCLPYGIALAIALVVWKYFTKSDATWEQVIKLAVIVTLMNAVTFCSFCSITFGRCYGVCFFFCLFLMLVAFSMEEIRGMEVLGSLFKTMALVFSLFALLRNPLIQVTYYGEDGMSLIADFGVEYRIILLGLGIVLLGIIWYDRFEGIRTVQFVGACLLMTILIASNLASPMLANVLFLAFVALAMLIVSTILRQKGYAILAAVTLILVALYLTRQLWMSIAWWVYLFVAGVGLVIFAIKKEKAEK